MGTVPVFSDLDFQNQHDIVNTATPIGGGGGGGSGGLTTASRKILSANNNGTPFQYVTPGEKDVILSTATLDTDLGYNAGTGEYTFGAPGLFFIHGQLQLDWTAGTNRTEHILTIRVNTGGGYVDLFAEENFGGNAHEKDSFAVQGFYQASTGDIIKMTQESNAGVNIDVDPDAESTFLDIFEVVGPSPLSEDPLILAHIHNNNVSLNIPDDGARHDVVFSSTAIDLDTAYNNVNGVYTFARDALVLVVAKMRNNDPNFAVGSGRVQMEIELDTGGGFNFFTTAQDQNSNAHTNNNLDAVTTIKAFNAEVGDLLKMSQNYEMFTFSWDLNGGLEDTYIKLIELNNPTDTTNGNRILLEAHNNGVDFTHTSTPGYEDVLWTTTNVDPLFSYNAATGEYTFRSSRRIFYTGQVKVTTTARTTKHELAIELDTGSGYSIINRYQRFNGDSYENATIHIYGTLDVNKGDKLKLSNFTSVASVVTYDGDEDKSFFQLIDVSNVLDVPVKEVLISPRTFYVDTTGDDANDGLTPASPFLTVAKAVEAAVSVEPVTFPVTIQLAAGDYTGQGSVTLTGGTGNSYTIEGAAASTSIINQLAISGTGNVWTVKDLVVDSPTTGISVTDGATLLLDGTIELRGDGTGGFDPHIYLQNNALVKADSITININNSSIPPTPHNAFYYVEQNSSLVITNSTIDFTNAIQYDYTVRCQRASFVNVDGTTWLNGGNITNNAAAAGAIQGNSTIYENGATIPGSLANSIDAATFCTLI